GFETYNMLVNPNNRLVKTVLMWMVESGDYFFFAISRNQSVTAFRSEIGQKNLAGLSTNLRQIQGSRRGRLTKGEIKYAKEKHPFASGLGARTYDRSLAVWRSRVY